MTALVAALDVLAVGALVSGSLATHDPRVRRLLGRPRSSRRSARSLPSIRFPVGGGHERRRLAAAVPELLDVLAVSVTAGLTVRLALDRAPEAVSGPMASLLTRVHEDISLGAPVRTALETAAARSGLDELRRLALVVHRAERLGAPVAERLRELAGEVREERRAIREERARRAPVQMLFPLVFLILPAFVLAVVVPAVLVATRDLS